MYAYECVFEHPDPHKPITKANGVQMTQTAETIVAETGMQALEYAKGRLELFPNYQLAGVIRRNPIVQIITEEKDDQPNE